MASSKPSVGSKVDDFAADDLRPESDTRLSPREQLFIVAFTSIGQSTYGNQAASAREAGYSAKSAKEIGYAIHKRPRVKAAITARFAEYCAGPDEALAVLASHLRRDFGPYLVRVDVPAIQNGNLVLREDGTPVITRSYWELDLKLLKRDGLTHLVSAIRNGDNGTSFEFVDSAAAADRILRANGAYKDRVSISGPAGGAVKIEYVNDWRNSSALDSGTAGVGGSAAVPASGTDGGAEPG